MNCFAGFERICQVDVPLAAHTWYRLGGPARWLLTPRDEAELAEVLCRCREHGVPWRVLGRGANVLVRDEGFDGAVIRLVGGPWELVQWEGCAVSAGAGADFPALVAESTRRGLAGLENLAGIPGSVGGIVRMNAGGKHGYVGAVTESVRVMDAGGAVSARSAQEVGFAYRRTSLAEAIVLAARFVLKESAAGELCARVQAIWQEKRAAQPSLGARSAGCVFKNPSPKQPAGLLLDRCALKGVRVGGAEISPKHANFVVVHAGATARDVLDLIALAQERVRASAGVELELEVEIW
jgi:UDP-N-acetylmuramate dehydrogenase